MSALLNIIPIDSKPRRNPVRHYAGTDVPHFSVAELKTFLDAAQKHGRREFAMFLTGFCQGMRCSEIANLKLADIRDGKIFVQRLKGSNSTWAEMFRVLGYDQAHVVELWLKERTTWSGAAESDAVFISQKGGKLDRSQIFRLFVQVCEEAGISKELRHPHVLRHSFGFISRQQGCELEVTQMGLGHKSIASTGIYTRVTRKEADKELKKAFKGLR